MTRYTTVNGYIVIVEAYGDTQEIIIMGNDKQLACREAKAEFIRHHSGNNPRVSRVIDMRELPTLDTQE